MSERIVRWRGGDADKELGVRDAKRSVECFTDFLSVKYLTIFAFD